MTHWFDELVLDAKAWVGDKPDVVVNAGLSVSGKQHVGRLRGEITLSHLIARSLQQDRKGLECLVL